MPLPIKTAADMAAMRLAALEKRKAQEANQLALTEVIGGYKIMPSIEGTFNSNTHIGWEIHLSKTRVWYFKTREECIDAIAVYEAYHAA